jgi:hypothetical protein
MQSFIHSSLKKTFKKAFKMFSQALKKIIFQHPGFVFQPTKVNH